MPDDVDGNETPFAVSDSSASIVSRRGVVRIGEKKFTGNVSQNASPHARKRRCETSTMELHYALHQQPRWRCTVESVVSRPGRADGTTLRALGLQARNRCLIDNGYIVRPQPHVFHVDSTMRTRSTRSTNGCTNSPRNVRHRLATSAGGRK